MKIQTTRAEESKQNAHLLNGRKKPLALAVSSVLSCAVAGPAAAQQPAFEEITVTATRRSTSTQDVPYNITAVSDTLLRSTGSTGLGDLTRVVPGIAFIDQGPVTRNNNNNLALRGLGVQSAANNNAFAAQTQGAVSTYIGETPVFYNISLKDMERIEVLRGPQGTLFGSGSLGGTIRFIPKTADLDGFYGQVDTTVGSTADSDDLNYSLDGVLNVPLVDDTFAARLSAGVTREAGFVDALGFAQLDGNGVPIPSDPNDLSSGFTLNSRQKDVNQADLYYARLSLTWEMSDRARARFRYQHDHSEQDHAQWVNPSVPSVTVNTSAGLVPGSEFVDPSSCGPGLQFPGYYLCGAGLPYPNGGTTFPATGKRDNLQLYQEPYESDVDSVALDVEVDFGFGSLTSATSFFEVEEEIVSDVTGEIEITGEDGGVSFASFYLFYPRLTDRNEGLTEKEGFVQELRFVSDWDKAWNFVVGGFYQKIESFSQGTDRAPGLAAWDQANFYYGFNNATLPDLLFQQRRETEFTDLAAFGEVNFNVTDLWQITLGARFFSQELDINYSQISPFCGPYCASDGADLLGTVFVPPNSEKTDDQVFKFNTSYDVSDSAMVYFTWSEGFRHGGANAISLAGANASLPEFLSYRPDKATNHELGIKGMLADNRVAYTLAGFFVKWDDFQFDAFSPSFQPYVLNGSEAETQGIELEIDARLTDQWSARFGYNYTDAEVTQDQVTFDLPLGGGAPVASNSLVAGDRLPNIPEHSVSISTDYFQPIMGDKTLHWNLNGSYRGETDSAFNPSVENFYALDSFWIWNAAVTLESDSWDVGLFVRNAGDEEGITGGIEDSVAGTRGRKFFVTRPQTIGLSFTYRTE